MHAAGAEKETEPAVAREIIHTLVGNTVWPQNRDRDRGRSVTRRAHIRLKDRCSGLLLPYEAETKTQQLASAQTLP